MRTTLLGLSAYVAIASANINFEWVQPTCQFSSFETSRCLTGQHCTRDNKCAANSISEHSKITFRSRSLIQSHVQKRQNAVQYSQDGKCGPANGNLLCDPKSTAYTGTCCSQYGWCGNSPAHCGTGCLSGCSNGAEPSVAVPASKPTPATGAAAPRDDGRCGKDFGSATCDPKGPYGGCCSSYGCKSKLDDRALHELTFQIAAPLTATV